MFLAYGFLGDKIAFVRPKDPTWSVFYVMLLEITFTFTMMMTILHGKHAKLSLFSDMVPGVFSSLIAIYFGIGCIGKLSGAVMNCG